VGNFFLSNHLGRALVRGYLTSRSALPVTKERPLHQDGGVELALGECDEVGHY